MKRKSGDTGDPHRTVLQVRPCSLSRRQQQAASGWKWKWNSRAENNKCWGSVEELEDLNGRKYPRWFFHRCINVWMHSDVCACHCCVMSATDIISAARKQPRWRLDEGFFHLKLHRFNLNQLNGLKIPDLLMHNEWTPTKQDRASCCAVAEEKHQNNIDLHRLICRRRLLCTTRWIRNSRI